VGWVEGNLRAKTSLIRPVVSTQYRLVTDGRTDYGDAENARPENDGQRKLWVWKMQDWKMTDKLLANCEHNYVCIFDVYLANYRRTLLELD